MNPVKIITLVMLVSLMLGVGLQCNREHLAAVLRNYGLLARALLANFIIVPILAVLVVRVFQLNVEIATGLLLMAIAPGVPFVVISGGRKKGGSLGFAIVLAFLMPALSVLTFPITAQYVLPSNEVGHLPVGNVLTSLLLFQLLPVVIGMILAFRAPALAEKIARPFGLLFIVAVVAFFVVLGPKLWSSVTSVYGSHGMLADLVVVALSICTGWLLGGPAVEYRRTLGIATGLRNIGLCALVATANFPDTLVPASVLAYLVVQFVVATIFGALFKRGAESTAPAPA